jgi:hypothetical protein
MQAVKIASQGAFPKQIGELMKFCMDMSVMGKQIHTYALSQRYFFGSGHDS